MHASKQLHVLYMHTAVNECSTILHMIHIYLNGLNVFLYFYLWDPYIYFFISMHNIYLYNMYGTHTCIHLCGHI